MHIWPSGDTYPCCLGDSRMPVGSTQKNTMQEIWNNNKMKTLRNNMLEGKKSPECRRCYEQEEHGIVTLRKSSNMNLKHHWWKVEETQPMVVLVWSIWLTSIFVSQICVIYVAGLVVLILVQVGTTTT